MNRGEMDSVSLSEYNNKLCLKTSTKIRVTQLLEVKEGKTFYAMNKQWGRNHRVDWTCSAWTLGDK